MGTYTYPEFQNKLRFEIGMRDDVDTDYTNVSLGGWVNAAYIDLTSREDLYFPELEATTTDSTADGTDYIDTPSDVLIIRTIWDSSSDVKLSAISLNDYVGTTGRADSTQRGAPADWIRHGSKIYLVPTPDAVYGITIYYRKRVTPLSGSGTTSVGAEWDEVILKTAVVQSLRRLKRYEEAVIEQKFLDERIRDLKRLYFQEHLDREDVRYPDSVWLKNEY